MKALCIALALYPLTTAVIDVDNTTNVVSCEDNNGYVWEFEGVENWKIGDVATMIMYNNNTDTIFDGEIVLVNYN